VEYFVVFPILALVGLIAIFGIGCLLVGAGLCSPTVALIVGAEIYLLFGVWLFRFAVDDYRRRSGVAVTIDEEWLTIDRPRRNVRVAYQDVETIRLVPCRHDARCLLLLSDGTACALPVEIALFSAVRGAMEATLVDVLATRLDEMLARGGTVRVHDSSFRAWARVVSGALGASAGVLMIMTLWGMPSGLIRLRRGLLAIRRGWRGRNTDFEVTCDGVRPAAHMADFGHDCALWSQLESCFVDDAGLVLRFDDGRVVEVSLFAENYWPFAVWTTGWAHT
jgi:hypothetical protein